MARFLALEWDSREARLAVASTRAGQPLIEQAFAVSLPARAEGQQAADTRTADTIATAVAGLRLGRVETLVAVGRASIELKQLSLPPAPTEELPDLVRFQAMREFTSLGESWPLDFLTLGADGDGPRQVLAAAISPELVEQIHETCRRADLTPQRLVLRPCAAASLLRRSHPAAQRVRLLVDLLADEADLTVMVDDQVVFLRTARLPGDVLANADEARPLLAEIRRTIAAAQNQLGGQKVEAIDLCGDGQDHAALAERMSLELGLPARLFDPFASLELSKGLRRSLPENTGRFAPLLGMLLDEAYEAGHTIDFLNPRKRPPAPSRRNRYAMAGGLAAAVLLLGGGWTWQALNGMNQEIAELEQQSAAMKPAIEKTQELQKATGEIEKWTATDVVWLDELAELARDLPTAEQAVLTSLQMDNRAIQLNGLVRAASVVDELEVALRDEHHAVEGRGRSQDAEVARYSWSFGSTISVGPQTPQDYIQRAAEHKQQKNKPAADSPAAAQTGTPETGTQKPEAAKAEAPVADPAQPNAAPAGAGQPAPVQAGAVQGVAAPGAAEQGGQKAPSPGGASPKASESAAPAAAGSPAGSAPAATSGSPAPASTTATEGG